MTPIEQLRAELGPDYAGFSDEDLARKYATATGADYGQVADMFGVQAASLPVEMGRQLVGGYYDLKGMVGKGLQYTNIAPEYGRELASEAEQQGAEYQPDVRGRGLLGKAAVYGARGLVPMAPALAAGFLPGGQVVAPAVAGTLFGTSSAQETYDKVLQQTGDEQAATDAARRVGIIQGPGEALATAVGARALRPLTGLLTGAKTTERVAAGMMNTDVWKPLAKTMGINALVQPGTEVAQDLGTYAVERAYGAAGDEDPYAIAEQSALGGLGLTMLLGPLAVGSHAVRASNASKLKYALSEENQDENLRNLAIGAITDEAKRQGVPDADVTAWFSQQMKLEDVRNEQLLQAETQQKMSSGDEVDLTSALSRRPAALPDTAFETPDQQLGLFNTRGGQQTTPGEQIDLFGAVGDQTAPTVQVDESQGDLFAPQPAQFQTRMTADMLDGVGLPRQSAYYRQLVGKDMSAPDAQQQVSAILTRVRQDPNISERTKSGMESLAMQAFGALAQQQEMFGPKGGAYPAGKPSTQTTLPGQPQNLLPTQTAAEAGYVPAAAQQTVAPEQTMAPQVTPEQMMRPELPAGAQLTPEQTRKFKQAQALYDMADTDAERRAVGSIMQGIIDTVAPTSQTTEQVSPPSVPAAAASPSAPVAEGISSTQENVPQATETVQAEAQGQEPAAELSPADQQQLQKLLDESEASDTKNVLPASVTSSGKAVPGKTRLNQVALASIRDALVKGKETASPITQRIVDALNNFASAYKVYSDEGGQAVSRRDSFGKKTTAEQYAEKSAEKIQLHAANVQAALAELGDAVGGNAKDVEAVVKLVKSMVQGKVATPGKTRSEVIQQLRQLDTMLSQAWGAAKREVFRTEGAIDTADIRTQSVRASQELQAKGEKSPLVTVANDGIYAGKDNGTLYGLPAILHYMRKHGTPMERVLATALRETLVGQEGGLKLKFIKEGNAHFDPKTNTVFLRENESPEVTLHEAFHAALQSFVYKNPTHPAVVQLKKSLKSVLNYKGELTGKAKEVQSLLAKLSSEGKELDAVLELVSYGTTLNEFRKALQEMKADPKAPKSFVQSLSRAWEAIKQIATRLLGGKRTLANDVLESSLELLDKARKQTPVVGQGNVLEAAITGGMEGQRTAADTEAKEVGYVDARQFNTVAGKWKTPTQIMFEAVGLGRVNGKDLKFTAAIKDSSGKVAEYIRKNMPTLERMILNFNSRFSNGAMQNDLIEKFKSDQNIGYLQMERVAQHLRSNPADAKPFLDYMDGNDTALDSLGKRGAGLKLMATDLRALFKDYIKSLPEGSAERRAFEKVPFTQYLLHPSNVGQIAGVSFGVQKLKGLLGIKNRGETSVDEFKQWLNTDENGDVDMDQPLYQVSNDNGPFGFISLDKFKASGTPAGTKVDTSLVWKIKQWKDGEYKFSASMTAQQIKDNLTTDELTAALLNTTAALGHTYASRNFINGMAKIGYVDGKATAGSVAFDDVAAVNAAFPDRKISDRMVLNVSDDASKSAEIRWKTQRTGTWVRMPASENYGALAGKIVPGPVWNSMVDMHDRAPLLRVKALNDTMAFFKKSKTVYNPGTHVTNILSNVTLAYMHGIPMKTVADAARMFARFEVSPGSLNATERAMVQAFYNSGAVLGNYSSTEVKRTVYAQLSEAITPDSDTSTMGKVLAFAKYEKLKAKVANFDAKATEIYAAEDNIFRLAAFLNVAGNIQMRDNTSMLNKEQLHEAGVAARKMFLDYDIDARAIRAMRQSFMPFISWSYAVMPVLGRIMIEKPWTMANVLLAYGLVSAATGGDDDEELRKAAPEYLRDKSFGGLGPYMHIRLPFLGDEENPVYFNLGKYVPMFTLFQPPAGATKVAGQEWIPGFVSPNGPYATVLSMLNGYDPFTGKPMHDPTDTQWGKLVTTVGAAYDMMAPGIIDAKTIKGIAQLSDGGVGPTGVEKSHLALARKLSGLGLYQFNVGESLFFQDNEVKKIKADFTTAMNKAKSKEMSKGYPDYEALDAELDELQKRLDARIAEIRGEEAPE